MKNLCKLTSLLAFPLFLALCCAGLHAQMVSPGIDRPGQPFSYFSKPTDEIGIMDAEAATEITPEGYLRTGFGELTGACQRAHPHPRRGPAAHRSLSV
jgi:hypothetical protein